MKQFQSTMWTLIAEAGGGSRNAVDHLLSRYHAPILHFLKAKGLRNEDAEDVSQEVFLQISQEEFLSKADQKKGKFRTLLLRVTQHILNSQFRKQYSQKRGGGKVRVPMEELADVAIAPEEQEKFDALWAKNLIQIGLEKLKADSSRLRVAYHDTLVLRYLEGNSQKEIARKLGIKEHDVENYIRNGRERLGRHLVSITEEYCSSPGELVEEQALLQKHSL